MTEELKMGLELVVPVIGLIPGLLGAYVGLQNRALLAEVRREIAELENRIIARINGTYVRAGECHLRMDHQMEWLQMIEGHVKNKNAAGG